MDPNLPRVPTSSIQPIYVFIGLILVFTVGIGIIMGSSSRSDIMAHWSERRCDFDVLMASFIYKPSSDTTSAFEFAANNFNFCVGSKAKDYLQSLFGSLFAILQKQMGAASVLTNVMKIMRTQLQKIYTPFSSMMDKFWLKFKQIGTLASRIFQHIYMAMKKAAATATASIYIAISLQLAFLNTLDFVINVIMIVLYIMIALAFIFFLPILPVMFFVTMAVNGIEAGMPGRTGTMGTIFCFAPNTHVILHDSTTLHIQDIQIGTVLLGGQYVEAILEVPGSDELYMLNGVKVSGEHLVLYTKQYITVKEHIEAHKINDYVPTLWTLITSNRQIPVRGLYGTILFSDWEEMPDTLESSKAWDSIVRSVLPCFPSNTVPTTPPCLDPKIKVFKFQSGLVPLSSIIRGDWIMGDTSWTKVIGICSREVNNCIYWEGSRVTDGVWIRSNTKWSHPMDDKPMDDKSKPYGYKWQGLHLITESGTFKILTAALNIHVVRDFTEVGWTNLAATYVKERAVLPNT